MSEEAEVRIGGVMLVPSANLSPNAKKNPCSEFKAVADSKIGFARVQPRHASR